jgi:hypothetical protein
LKKRSFFAATVEDYINKTKGKTPSSTRNRARNEHKRTDVNPLKTKPEQQHSQKVTANQDRAYAACNGETLTLQDKHQRKDQGGPQMSKITKAAWTCSAQASEVHASASME